MTGYRADMSQRPNYSAMTINERLAEAGLLDAFDKAATTRDRAAMLRLLAEVDAPDPASTADPILNDPTRYGY